MLPLISVIVPIYNVAAYLPKCLSSLQAQTYPSLEFILVDDGSEDNSRQICNEFLCYDIRYKIIVKENGGLSDARNKGIEKAKGEYVFFLDGDDFLPPYAIEVLYETLRQHNADISCGKILEYTSDSHLPLLKKECMSICENTTEALASMLYMKKTTNSACGKLYSLKIFEHIRFPKGKLYEDLATTYKLIAQSNKVAFVDEYVYYYYKARSSSIMNQKFNTNRLLGHEYANEIVDYVTINYPTIRNAAYYRLIVEDLFFILPYIPYNNEFKEERMRLWHYIRKYRLYAIKDSNTTKVQKVLLFSTFMGEGTFRWAWKLKEYLRQLN